MTRPNFLNKNVLVVGMARSGIAAANFLQAQGARVSITDSKPAATLHETSKLLRGHPRLVLGGHEVSDFLEADLIIISPGVPSNLRPVIQARDAGVPVWSEVELAYAFLTGPVVGVTGSNGKTTTTALLGEMFQQAGIVSTVAGNIGHALTGTLGSSSPKPQTWVVELSSFQLENIHRFHCHVAVLLNLTPDHQDRYATFDDYQEAKARIFLNQTSDDYSVANADDPLVVRLVDSISSRRVWFSRHRLPIDGAGVEDGTIWWSWEGSRERLLPASELALKGAHNLENALAAVAAARVSHLPSLPIVQALRSFPGVEHRLEWVRTRQEVNYYNDSKATNVASARVALESLDGPLLLILGGLDKGQDFSLLRDLVKEKARCVVLIGQSADRLAELLEPGIPQCQATTMEGAVCRAAELAQPGDSVLLAPACASFDMFTNFEERGRVFKSAVLSLSEKEERTSAS